MLYLAIPAHNEAATIGVLLWRLRTVLAEFPREYEAVVYDDASSDSTSEILESYARVMPLTVLRGERQVGYAGAVDALIRHVVRDTRYPRRDAMLLLQGDFTDSPSLVPEFVKRFEGGTDVVVGERGGAVRRKAPTPVRRLMRAEPWLLRFLVRADGIRDLTSSYRLVRISVLRDLMRATGEGPMLSGDARTANADLLMRLVPLARRVETLEVEPTWDVRLRETRVVAMADGMNLLRWAWKSRGLRAVPSSAPEPAADNAPRNTRGARDGRPELRLESRDLGTDVTIASSDNTRISRGRDSERGESSRFGSSRGDSSRDNARGESARGERKSKSPRGEGRGEKRSDARAEPRNDARGEGRRDTRNESRSESRPELRVESDALALDAESLTLAGNGETSAEKPPRRKRSRRGGRDREAARQASEDESRLAGSAPAEGAPAMEIVRSVRDDQADEAGEDREPVVELSAGLSDAVADAEAEHDEEGSQRPRRKRRRRGSRSGRKNGGEIGAGAAEGDVADGATQDEGESPYRESADSDSEVDSSSESEVPARQRRPSRRAELSSADDIADGAVAGEGADSDDGERGDDATEEGAEGRTRRRGRRGRRGGSRRSRLQRGDSAGGEGEGGESNGDSGGDSGANPTRAFDSGNSAGEAPRGEFSGPPPE